MMTYQEQYRDLFAALGIPLTDEDAVAESDLAAAEERAGVRLPAALRDYYQVAGNERELNRAHNRLLPLDEWVVDSAHVIFMEENQAVVLWAATCPDASEEDPPVYQAANDETLEWTLEHEHCSVFLKVMLHWQATWGGMPWVAVAAVPAALVTQLDQFWTFVGEVNGMRAYNRQGQAVCFLRWEDSWRVFAGTHTEADLNEIADDLGIEWEEVGNAPPSAD
jgi:hypothetical protein